MGIRDDLPSGTVTLLFTDVEGSTELLHALGDRYAEVLADHRRLLRDAFRERGGVEVDTQGDAFFYAFSSAGDAVRAAANAQRALAGHAWPDGHELRVRMGVHMGEPIRTDEGYVGIDLHRGARLMAAAAGGQVAVSETTAAAVANAALDDAFLIDLGEHALKDFSLPQRVYQLTGPGLEAAFPPLKTLSARFANIPTLGGPLVGRADEVAAIVDLLAEEGERLVTLTGPGGTGKTSLALRAGAELLERMTDGVVFCDLAPVADPGLLPAGIAAALGLREKGGVPTLDVIASFIGQKQLLLILDNLEQLLDGVAVISKLLDACPQLAIIATSRAPLRLAREREQPVGPLTQEDALDVLAVRARRADPRFSLDGDLREQATALCARLDNLPLAIELAAARLRLFELPELLERLETRLPLLTGGRRDAPARQQTLRATLDWSFDLLDPSEQQALARVAVFSGGFSAEAAEAVCDAAVDAIGLLVEHSLVRRQQGRLTLLETIREYGLERLAERGEMLAFRRRHADWFIGVADQAAGELYGSQQVAWLDRLELELDNLRTAHGFLLEASDTNGALELTSSLWVFWEARRAAEGRRLLEASLENRAGVEPHVLAQGLFAIGQLWYFEGAMPRAGAFLEEAARLCRETGNDPWLAVTLSRLSWVALDTGSAEEALRLAREALAALDRVSAPWARGETLNFAGTTFAECGEGDLGLQLLEQSRATYLAMGNDQRAADVLNNLGWASMMEGDLVAARGYHSRNLEVARRVRDGLRLGLALGNLGVIETLAGDIESARPLMRESLILLRDRGERRSLPEAFVVAAATLANRGDVDDAGRLVGAIEAMNETDGRDLQLVERQILDQQILARVAPGGSEAFERARAQGRDLTLTDAIALALAALGD